MPHIEIGWSTLTRKRQTVLGQGRGSREIKNIRCVVIYPAERVVNLELSCGQQVVPPAQLELESVVPRISTACKNGNVSNIPYWTSTGRFASGAIKPGTRFIEKAEDFGRCTGRKEVFYKYE